jgi:serine/threonine-protein kinase
LTAAVLDARRRALRTEVDLRGSTGRIDRVIDSLAVAVLRALAPPGAIASSAGTPLGTTSYPALKAFLRGEQYYRQSEFDSARSTFRRAVMLDSSFALAWHRLSQSTHWQDSTETFDQLDPEIVAASFRAAGIHHVSAHDSLLVSADSVFWALPELMPGLDKQFWSAHSRLFGTLEDAQKRFPTDPDVALALAEAGWQWGGFSGRPLESTLANYDRAIALDSAFTPAYVHALFIALGLGRPAQARVYLEACLRRTHSGATRETLLLIQALLGVTPEDRASADRLMDSLPPRALSHAFGLLAMSADSGEAVIQALRAAVARRDAYFSSWHGPLGVALGSRGHIREAYRELSHDPDWDSYSTYDPLLQDYLPPETFRTYLTLWARSDDPWRARLPPALRLLAATGDTATLKHLVGVNVRAHPETRAFLALGRRDTAQAVAQFLALPDSTILWSWDTRLTKAQLLRSTGHLREAAEALRRPFRPEGSNYMPGDGLWALERGRVYERLGQHAAAARGYQTVVDLWRHPDPELQPMVNEARQALRRLGHEPQ